MAEVFEVRPFSAPALYDALSTERCTPEEVAAQGRAQYLFGYLKDLGAQSILIERDYTDGDYLEDFAAYYVRCFQKYEKRCSRLHFFGSKLSEEDIVALAQGTAAEAKIEELKLSYLGFVVARPLPNAIVGRTLLRTYPPDNGRRHYTVVRRYVANVLGLEFMVESLPFQEQDTVLAACATVALWSAFQKTSELFGTPAPRPATITRTANGVVHFSRPIPSHGLSVVQMCHAVRDVGLDPEVVPANQNTPLVSLIRGHLAMGVPVVLIADIEGVGHHAITLTGYSILKAPALTQEVAGGEKCIPMTGLRVNEFYGHDDQIGPFARLVVKPSAANHPVLFEGSWIDRNTGKLLSIRPLALLIPVYNKIRVTFIDVQKWLTRLTATLPSVFGQNPAIEWDLSLVTSNTYKQQLRQDTMPALVRQNLLVEQHPRFIWRATLHFQGQSMLELLFDATDMERSFPLYRVRWPHEALKNAFVTMLSTPALDTLLTQLLTRRFREFLLSQST